MPRLSGENNGALVSPLVKYDINVGTNYGESTLSRLSGEAKGALVSSLVKYDTHVHTNCVKSKIDHRSKTHFLAVWEP